MYGVGEQGEGGAEVEVDEIGVLGSFAEKPAGGMTLLAFYKCPPKCSVS